MGHSGLLRTAARMQRRQKMWPHSVTVGSQAMPRQMAQTKSSGTTSARRRTTLLLCSPPPSVVVGVSPSPSSRLRVRSAASVASFTYSSTRPAPPFTFCVVLVSTTFASTLGATTATADERGRPVAQLPLRRTVGGGLVGSAVVWSTPLLPGRLLGGLPQAPLRLAFPKGVVAAAAVGSGAVALVVGAAFVAAEPSDVGVSSAVALDEGEETSRELSGGGVSTVAAAGPRSAPRRGARPRSPSPCRALGLMLHEAGVPLCELSCSSTAAATAAVEAADSGTGA